MNPAIVWLTSGTLGTPHARALQAANPGAEIHTWTAPDTGRDGWKNCDRNIREWWRAKWMEVRSEWVLFLEWDVFCDVPISSVITVPRKGVGMVVPRLFSVVADRRRWMAFEEVPKLPREIQSLAIGGMPNAAVMLSLDALEAVLDPRWDAVFAEDILSELRLGTVVRASGFKVVSDPLWKDVGTVPLDPEKCRGGIFHPVKMEVPL